MINNENLMRAVESLKEIAEYDVRERHGFVDEWNEASSFNECQRIAQEALKILGLK